MPRPKNDMIAQCLLEGIWFGIENVVPFIAEELKVSRQTVSKYMKGLIDTGLVEVSGATSARKYKLRVLEERSGVVMLGPTIEDDTIWQEVLAPLLRDTVSKRTFEIGQYGFTEMFNNVIDHSESKDCYYIYERDAVQIYLGVTDYGVGIFEKIRKAFNLDDRRHALLELTKGKLTTDASRHSGEGIFFTSRAVDRFVLMSGDLVYMKRQTDDGWLMETETGKWLDGTRVYMRVRHNNPRTLKDVFDKYSTGEDYGFGKTHVPISLAKFGSENLVSRSQARRLLARVDRFSEVLLDFDGVDAIGQAFADEVFRVFASQHPDVELTPIRCNQAVKDMIQRAKARRIDPEQGTLL